MCLKIAKLKFASFAHFGQIGIGIEGAEEVVHSDTLFSALCHSWVNLYGKLDLDDFLSSFQHKPSFLLSSCFVYNGDTFFLPKPHTRPPGFGSPDIRERYAKLIKGLSYLPLELFALWDKREKIEYEAIKEAYPDYDSSYEFLLQPRVALDRATLNSQIFHCQTVKFAENCGLYFLVKFNDPTYEKKVRSSLSLLGGLGLGGERSSGLGKFDLDWEDADDKWERLFMVEGDGYCGLSLFHPEDLKTVDDLVSGASYALLERRGWTLSPFRRKQYKRKTVTMFSEGSVFAKPITGHLVDVTPAIWEEDSTPHSIYRYGFAFTIPIKREGNGL